MTQLNKINKAGFIPYFLDEASGKFKYLMMVSSDAAYGGDLPMVSKGGQDPADADGSQETVVDTAFREAEEELGLKEENVVESFYLMSKSYPKYDLYIFAGQIKDPDDFVKPCYETEFTVWMTADEFFEKGRKDHRVFVDHLENTLQSTT